MPRFRGRGPRALWTRAGLSPASLQKQQEEALTDRLAEALRVQPEDRRLIGEWLAVKAAGRGKQPPHGSPSDADLLGRLGSMPDEARTYLWARVTKLFALLPLMDAWEMKSVEEALAALKPIFPGEGFAAFVGYVANCKVGPNGYLFDHIWMAERWSRFFRLAPPELADQVAVDLLRLNAGRVYHHNIKDFKRILSFVKPDHVGARAYLANYRVVNFQGCYEVIRHILAYPLPSGVELKCRIIAWLDNAAGAEPKKPWLDKLAELKACLPERGLETICARAAEDQRGPEPQRKALTPVLAHKWGQSVGAFIRGLGHSTFWVQICAATPEKWCQK